MAFSYRDKYGILHAVSDEKTAKEYAVGEVIEYNGACIGGYPAVVIEVMDYGNGRIYLAGNEKSGLELNKAPGVIGNEVRMLLKNIGI